MPQPTPCTQCQQPSATKFCPHCGANQAHRFPENELVDFMINAYERTKPKDGETPTANQAARHASATRRMLALHALCVKIDSAFLLPDSIVTPAEPA